jgi:predicted nicotinamide N-methyase
MADPGRAYVPEDGLLEVARYDVPVLRELEDRDRRDVTIWRLQGAG